MFQKEPNDIGARNVQARVADLLGTRLDARNERLGKAERELSGGFFVCHENLSADQDWGVTRRNPSSVFITRSNGGAECLRTASPRRACDFVA